MTYQSLMIFHRVRRYRSSLKNIGPQRRIENLKLFLKIKVVEAWGDQGGPALPRRQLLDY